MNINRGNYEEWMIDYVEGTLSAVDEERVRNFLKSNPDLKAEIDEFEVFTLEPSGNNSFNDKQSLKKNSSGIEGVSRNDYLHIKKAEGLLHGAEKQEYDVLMETTQGAEREQMLYNKTILSAEKSVLYPDKLKLKRVTLLPFFTKDRFNKVAAVSIIFLIASSIWATFNFDIIKPSLTASLKQPNRKEQPVTEQQPVTITKEVTVEPEEVLIATAVKPVVTPAHKKIVPTELTMPDRTQMIALETISAKGVDKAIKPVELNGYEVALNEIMPLYISALQNVKQKPEIKTAQPPTFEKTNPLLAGSVKIINRMTGNNLRFNKRYNNQGDVVAYRFASSNLQIDHKVKK